MHVRTHTSYLFPLVVIHFHGSSCNGTSCGTNHSGYMALLSIKPYTIFLSHLYSLQCRSALHPLLSLKGISMLNKTCVLNHFPNQQAFKKKNKGNNKGNNQHQVGGGSPVNHSNNNQANINHAAETWISFPSRIKIAIQRNHPCSFCNVYGNYMHHFPHLEKS